MNLEITVFQKGSISRGLTSYGAMVADRNSAEFEALFGQCNGVYETSHKFNSIHELECYVIDITQHRCVADIRIRPVGHEAHIQTSYPNITGYVTTFFLGRKQHLNKSHFQSNPFKTDSLEELQKWIDENSFNLPKD
jgi:hypothetical protein